MTAAVRAAVCRMFELASSTDIRLPDGTSHGLPIEEMIFGEDGSCRVLIRKDAGDDPDVTHGMRFEVTVHIGSGVADDRDLVLSVRPDLSVVLHGGDGIGYVTLPGLAASCGKWAINPGPLRILKENLADLPVSGVLFVTVTAEGGAEIAEKTMNPRLGILGGISILGNSGYVEPHSHAAWIETIRLTMSQLAQNRIGRAVFCTGHTTALYAEQCGYDPLQIIRIGDFIEDALKIAVNFEIPQIEVICQPGKLVKYAQGARYTHAHTVSLDTSVLADVARECGLPSFPAMTAGSYLSYLPLEKRILMIAVLKKRALHIFQTWLNPSSIILSMTVIGTEAVPLN